MALGAIHFGIPQTSTLERVADLTGRGYIATACCAAIGVVVFLAAWGLIEVLLLISKFVSFNAP